MSTGSWKVQVEPTEHGHVRGEVTGPSGSMTTLASDAGDVRATLRRWVEERIRETAGAGPERTELERALAQLAEPAPAPAKAKSKPTKGKGRKR